MLTNARKNLKVVALFLFVLVFFQLLIPNLIEAINYDYGSNDLYLETKAELREKYGIDAQKLELITPGLWTTIYESLKNNESRSVSADPWEIIYADLRGESGFGIMVMYDDRFESDHLLTDSNAWFVDAVTRYAANASWSDLGSLVEESGILNRILINSMAYNNEIERYSLRSFLQPDGRDNLIDNNRKEFDYSNYLDTTLRWDGLGNLSHDTAGILVARTANTLWTALDLIITNKNVDFNFLLVIDAAGNTLVLSYAENILEQLNSVQNNLEVRGEQIVMLSDTEEFTCGIVTESGLLVMDGKIISMLID